MSKKKFAGGSGDLFKFNWWKFAPAGTGASNVKGVEYGDRIKLAVVCGNTPSLRLDFSQSAPQNRVNVDLFNLSGRLITTLYSGRTASSPLMLPLNDLEILSGMYLVCVALDGFVIHVRTMAMH